MTGLTAEMQEAIDQQLRRVAIRHPALIGLALTWRWVRGATALELEVSYGCPDRETGMPVRIIMTETVDMTGDDMISNGLLWGVGVWSPILVRAEKLVQRAFDHEFRECFHLDGKRVHDPHRGEVTVMLPAYAKEITATIGFENPPSVQVDGHVYECEVCDEAAEPLDPPQFTPDRKRAKRGFCKLHQPQSCAECGASYVPGNPNTCQDCRSKRWKANIAALDGHQVPLPPEAFDASWPRFFDDDLVRPEHVDRGGTFSNLLGRETAAGEILRDMGGVGSVDWPPFLYRERPLTTEDIHRIRDDLFKPWSVGYEGGGTWRPDPAHQTGFKRLAEVEEEIAARRSSR